MAEEALPTVASMIEKRMDELRATYVAMARWSRLHGAIAVIMKLMVVVLGAFVAFRDATEPLFGNANATIHLVASILIALLAAVEAALQLERRSERLNLLATTCRNLTYQIESRRAKL